jgi:NADPH:quinone reductase-like Zn-dependent oxidoreductase
VVPEVILPAHHNLVTQGGLTRHSRGKVALIHAGASGVGTAGIQLLVASGVQTFVTVGTPEKAEACRKLGARAILYTGDKFAERVMEETQGRGADVILDPVGASYLEKNLSCLATDGTIVLIGLMGGRQAPVDLSVLLAKRARLLGSTLRSLALDRKAAVVAAFREQFLGDLEREGIRPVVDSIFSSAEVAKAHERMEANANIGKIVMRWD